MKNIIAFVSLAWASSAMAESPVILQPSSPQISHPEQLYHFKTQSSMSCNDRKIIAEISDAIKHPGTLSDNGFMRLAEEGKCSTWSTDTFFKVIEFETFDIPAGPQTVASSIFNSDGPSPLRFYAMQADIEKKDVKNAIPFKEYETQLDEAAKSIGITSVVNPTLLRPAHPDCHFTTHLAIVCTTARNAAYAFENFGFDGTRINQSYNLQRLHDAGCSHPYEPNTTTIKPLNSGKIATPSGWVPIIAASINDKDLFYFAEGYVTAACRKYIAEGSKSR